MQQNVKSGVRRALARPARQAADPAGLGIALAAGYFALGLWLSLPPQGTGGATASLDPATRLDASAWTAGQEANAGLGRLGLGRLERIIGRVGEASDSCLRAGVVDRLSARKAELSRLLAILSESELARRLLDQAARKDVYICIDDGTALLGYYLSGLRLIGLNPRLSEGQKIAFLAHELSHVPQHNAYSDNRFYPARDLILLRRVREAAAEAAATRIAWQLCEQGHTSAWDEKKADPFYGDIVRAFAGALGAHPAERSELAAARAAFDQWFALFARLNLYDRMTVDHLARLSRDDRGLVSPRRKLTHEFLQGIARLDGGGPVFETRGRRLTGPTYAGHLSGGNASQLERILEDAEARSDGYELGPLGAGTPEADAPAPSNPWAVSRH